MKTRRDLLKHSSIYMIGQILIRLLRLEGARVAVSEPLPDRRERAIASGKPALVNVVIRRDTEYSGGIYV